jgi:hypothetical protein
MIIFIAAVNKIESVDRQTKTERKVERNKTNGLRVEEESIDATTHKHAERNGRKERAQRNRADVRTANRSHFANTIVARVANEHGAVCIYGHAVGKVEAGVRTGRIDKKTVGAIDPTSKR